MPFGEKDEIAQEANIFGAGDTAIEEKPQSRLSYGRQLAGYWTQDIPKAIKGIAGRTWKRAESVMQPTVSAEMLGMRQPSALADIVGAPERTGRAFLQGGATLADIIASGIGLAGSAANRLSVGATEKLTAPITQTVSGMVTPVGEAYQTYKAGLSPGGQASLEATTGGAEFLASGIGATKIPAAARVPGKVLTGAGKAEKEMAYKIQSSISKPTMTEVKEGFKRENIFKYNLKGKPAEMHDQTQAIIVDYADRLKTAIQEKKFDPKDPQTRVNGVQAFNRAADKTIKETRLNPKKRAEAVANIKEELETHYGWDFNHAPAIKNNVDLWEAQLLKREVGREADFITVRGHPVKNIDANSMASFYNNFYIELKKELENKGGEEIKKYNQILSDLIPIERAAGRRALVASRNEVIPLKEYIGFGLALTGHPMEATIIAAQVASKSPKVAKGLYKAGKFTQKIGEKITPK